MVNSVIQSSVAELMARQLAIIVNQHAVLLQLPWQ